MHCPSCYGEELISEESGRLVCANCGEELSGFQEEETDAFLAGTAVSNRQSQSQQAQSTRERISTPSTTRNPSGLSVRRPSKWRFCELVARTALKVLNLLIAEGLEKNELKRALFAIWAYWTDHVHHIGSSYTMLHVRNHAYSLVCLASIHIRSATLVRDMRRAALSSQSSLYHDDVYRQLAEQQATTTRFVPSGLVPGAGRVEIFAQRHARSDFAWPHVRSRFLQWSAENSFRGVPTVPVGNRSIVCLRLCRLLGLPDEFGARVMRYMELERLANVNKVVKHETHEAQIRNAQLRGKVYPFVPNFDNESYRTPTIAHANDVTSDEQLLIAFLNTMRLCYCALPKGVKVDRVAQSDMQKLLAESKRCSREMERWSRTGFFEDMYSINWSGLSPRSLSRSQGRHVRSQSAIVDILLTEAAERAPDIWGNFIETFQAIGFDSTSHAEQQDAPSCSYDAWRKGQYQGSLKEQCLSSTQYSGEGQDEIIHGGLPRRAWTGRFAGKNAGGREKGKRDVEDIVGNADVTEDKSRNRTVSDDIAFLSLACSIMRRFFSGQSCIAMYSDPLLSDIVFQANWKRKCRSSLDAVLAYLRELKTRE